jgi:uncharacterized protein YjbI with pentapeptide repeats
MARQLKDIVTRLSKGETAGDIPAERIDGRLVVRGLHTDAPVVTGGFDFGRWKVEETSGPTVVNRATISNLHFIDCKLSHVMLDNVRISNCVFEECRCREFGFWLSRTEHSIFTRTDLRNSAMGGVDPFPLRNKVNRFESVVFDECDLRDTAHSSEDYIRCLFKNCRLDGVSFAGAVFESCKFVGRLEDVDFRRSDNQSRRKRPNHLAKCDFREAELVDCTFMNIGLDPAMFPQDEDRIVLPNGPEDLRRWKALLGSDNLFLDHVIRLSGAPAIEYRSVFLRAGFTSEQVDLLEEIATGRH